MNTTSPFPQVPPTLATPRSPHQKKFLIAGVALVAVILMIVTLYSVYLGAKIAPSRNFKILGPRTVTAGQTATITWDASPENVKRYPYEKIEYCYGKLLKKKCVVLAVAALNSGQAKVKVPVSLPEGKGYLKLTARDPNKKLVGSLVSASGTVSVEPTQTALSNSIGSDSGESGSSDGGGSGGSGATSSGDGGGGSVPNPTPTPTPGGGGGGSTPTSTPTSTPIPTPTPSTEPGAAGVHVSYFDGLTNGLKYATNISGNWVAETIDPGDWVGLESDLAVDSNGKIHIATSDRAYGFKQVALKYMTNVSGSWAATIVDIRSRASIEPSIAVDSNNKIHMSYFDAYEYYNSDSDYDATGDLRYATNVSGSWVITVIDSNGSVGRKSAIAVDRNNKVHISYFDEYDGSTIKEDLKYATNASGSWTTQTIDAQGDAGSASSIKTDSNNKAHISYFRRDDDFVNLELKYATNVTGGWVTSIVDTAAQVGEFNSLALDAQDKAHIAYYDTLNKDLRYATNVAGSWTSSIVDSTDFTGQFCAIAADSQGKMHISYGDATDHTINYATNASGSWAISVVDSDGGTSGINAGGGTQAVTSIGVFD